MEFDRKNLIQLIALSFFAKLLIVGASFADCVGAFVLLSAILTDLVLVRILPKPVDVYKELEEVNAQLSEYKAKLDTMEGDVTALKIGSARR